MELIYHPQPRTAHSPYLRDPLFRSRGVSLCFTAYALNTDVILGTYFLDRHVKSIAPIDGTLTMRNGSRVLLARRYRRTSSIRPGEPCIPCSKTKCGETITLAPKTQTWMTVVSEQRGEILLEQNPALFQRYGLMSQHTIKSVRPNAPFRILAANFTEKSAKVSKRRIVAYAQQLSASIRT